MIVYDINAVPVSTAQTGKLIMRCGINSLCNMRNIDIRMCRAAKVRIQRAIPIILDVVTGILKGEGVCFNDRAASWESMP